MEIAKHLLSPKESALYLNCSLAKVRRDIFERRLAVVKVGRLVRIKKETLDELIEKGTKPARTETE